MKYLLTIMIFAAVSCKKDDNPAPPPVIDPTATSCTCRTTQTTPVYTTTSWTFGSTVADVNAVSKITLRRTGTLFPVFDIEKPISKNYTYSILFDKCPTFSDNAFYFFEWIMKDGRIVKGNSFQIWE